MTSWKLARGRIRAAVLGGGVSALVRCLGLPIMFSEMSWVFMKEPFVRGREGAGGARISFVFAFLDIKRHKLGRR